MVSLAGSSSLVPVLLPQLTGELGIIWWFWFLLWGQQRGASVLVPGLPGTEHLPQQVSKPASSPGFCGTRPADKEL